MAICVTNPALLAGIVRRIAGRLQQFAARCRRRQVQLQNRGKRTRNRHWQAGGCRGISRPSQISPPRRSGEGPMRLSQIGDRHGGVCEPLQTAGRRTLDQAVAKKTERNTASGPQGRGAVEPAKWKFKHGFEASYDNSPRNLEVYNTAKRLAKKNSAFRCLTHSPAVPGWLKISAYEL